MLGLHIGPMKDTVSTKSVIPQNILSFIIFAIYPFKDQCLPCVCDLTIGKFLTMVVPNTYIPNPPVLINALYSETQQA